MKCKLLVCILLSCILFSSAFSQTKKIAGTVSDDKGTTLPGATVSAKGTTVAAKTDINGKFSIEVPVKTKTLLVTFIGMQTEEITIGKSTNVDVSLKSVASILQDVVVIGYGTRKKADITSAISSVKTKDLKDMPLAGIDQALQGKVAGVTVTNNSGQPGGGVSIRVRGITTINSNDPLIVIDGVPFVSNVKSNSGYAGLGGSDGQTGNSVMATINPNDIESIDILKDASAQAIYGSQAANGVVLITTKKGKAGEGKISYDVYYGRSYIQKKLDIMNLSQYATYQNSIVGELGITPTPEFADPSVLGRGTDWQDAIFKNGAVSNHQLSFSGGKDNLNYYFSLNTFNQDGILVGSNFKRYSSRFNLDNQIKKWLKVGISSNINRSIQNVTLADAAEGTIWWSTIQSPLVPVKNLDGSWAGNQTTGSITYNQDNPVARASLRGNKSTNTSVFGNVYAELSFLKYFNLRNEVSYSLGNNNNMAFALAGNIGNTTQGSQLGEYRGNSYYYALRNYLNYNRTFGKHNVSATAGHEAQYSYYESLSGKKINLRNNIVDLNAGGSGTDAERKAMELGGGKSEWAMESYFVRGNYVYDNRYSLSLSYRADGSSNFAPGLKWGYFPGASAAWTVTNEQFAEGLKKYVGYLKLRVGYGEVGNQNLPGGAPNPPYTSTVRFDLSPVGFGSANFINGISNAKLTWEKVETKNIGIDFNILKGKIDVSFDAYKKTTKDMLLFSTGPRLLGVGDNWDDLKAPIGNVGQMTNTGMDLTINTTNISNKNFTWKSNIIFSSYKNRLDKLVNESVAIDGRIYYDNYLVTHTLPGTSVGSFWGLKTDGLFRTPAELASSYPQFGLAVAQNKTWLGDVRFKDINGDSKINESDFTYIGSPLPKFTYGLTNTFAYKGIDLTIFFQGSYGAKIFNFLRWQTESLADAYNNQLVGVLDRYTSANTAGSLPRFTNLNTNNRAMSDRYIENGSYARIQNLAIGYRVPKKYSSKALISNLRVYFSCQNLYTFSNYSGYDPEVGAFNGSIKLMNVDMGHYPNPRSFTFGANVEF
jgi:TonB-linked SusC/RagA family outer membrane protein